MSELTWEKLANEVAAVAAEYPNFKYRERNDPTRCVYEDPDSLGGADGGPLRCIVGLALHRLDVMPEEFRDGENVPPWSPQFAERVGLLAGQHPDARNFLSSAQEAQDDGVTWGEAVHLAAIRSGYDAPVPA